MGGWVGELKRREEEGWDLSRVRGGQVNHPPTHPPTHPPSYLIHVNQDVVKLSKLLTPHLGHHLLVMPSEPLPKAVDPPVDDGEEEEEEEEEEEGQGVACGWGGWVGGWFGWVVWGCVWKRTSAASPPPAPSCCWWCCVHFT